ncbi:hypothetical protein ANN_19443 [Periplaneta americana]|uniref:Endonuclease-reverse transcriptase n=1 Tax=Periplaneta americana TaxID=6978 RepID=A0ABQ8SAY9_PERAM|nr:hypothetical protein ANN_19443 [Periplaneta americana]
MIVSRDQNKRRINIGNAYYYSDEKLLSSSLLSKKLKLNIYKTIILPVVLYGCETWTLILREEQRLRVFKNKVLRKIFGAKRDEVTGEWRKLHNAELYAEPNVIRNIKSRRLRWVEHVARMGESRNATVSSQFTARLSWLVLLAQSLAFTKSRTPDLQRRSAALRTQVPQLRSTALELRASGSTVTDTTQVALWSRSWLHCYTRLTRLLYITYILYGCETWTLTLGEEQRLRVFENKVHRKIFGAKRDEVTGEWRKLHNAELHALYTSPDTIRNIKSRHLRWAGHVARMGKSRNAYRVLVGRPKGKRPLRRPRRRWEDNIKMDLREVVYDDRDWINLAQDRDQWRSYVRAAMNLRVP